MPSGPVRDNDSLTDEVELSVSDRKPVQSNAPLAGVGLDDLLQGITMDQVSELLQALNSEPSLDSVRVGAGAAFSAESTFEVI